MSKLEEIKQAKNYARIFRDRQEQRRKLSIGTVFGLKNFLCGSCGGDGYKETDLDPNKVCSACGGQGSVQYKIAIS